MEIVSFYSFFCTHLLIEDLNLQELADTYFLNISARLKKLQCVHSLFGSIGSLYENAIMRCVSEKNDCCNFDNNAVP